MRAVSIILHFEALNKFLFETILMFFFTVGSGGFDIANSGKTGVQSETKAAVIKI